MRKRKSAQSSAPKGRQKNSLDLPVLPTRKTLWGTLIVCLLAGFYAFFLVRRNLEKAEALRTPVLYGMAEVINTISDHNLRTYNPTTNIGCTLLLRTNGKEAAFHIKNPETCTRMSAGTTIPIAYHISKTGEIFITDLNPPSTRIPIHTSL
jgi:hypothetical protein